MKVMFEVGTDVTEIIGVHQYEATMDKEPPELAAKQAKVKWPRFLMRFAWFRQLVLP